MDSLLSFEDLQAHLQPGREYLESTNVTAQIGKGKYKCFFPGEAKEIARGNETEFWDSMQRTMPEVEKELEHLTSLGCPVNDIRFDFIFGADHLREAQIADTCSVVLPASKYEGDVRDAKSKKGSYGFDSSVSAKLSKKNPDTYQKNVILHEIGHILHAKTSPTIYQQLRTNPTDLPGVGDPSLPEALGEYCSIRNSVPNEFIAEAFVLLANKKSLSPDLLSDYLNYGGPNQVVPFKQLSQWACKNGLEEYSTDERRLREEIANRQYSTLPTDLSVDKTTKRITNRQFSAVRQRIPLSQLSDSERTHHVTKRTRAESSVEISAPSRSKK